MRICKHSTLVWCALRKVSRMKNTIPCIYCFFTFIAICVLTITVNKRKPVHEQGINKRPFKCQGCFRPNFEILTNNRNVCRNIDSFRNVSILFLIHSAPRNVNARNTLRETWLRDTKYNTGYARYVFLIGRLANGKAHEHLLNENHRFQDIIEFKFVDSYRNLTYKTMMGLKWAVTFCNGVKFVFKADDDVYINIPNVFNTLKQNHIYLTSALGGQCSNKSERVTDPSSKWYVTQYEFPDDFYPGQCEGPGYLTSMEVIKRIVRISENVPFFHLEDIYVGLCIRELNMTFHTMNGFFHTSYISHTSCNFKHQDFVMSHHVSLAVMKKIWKTPCPASKLLQMWKQFIWIISGFW